jgi:putative ABC transport system permease protein
VHRQPARRRLAGLGNLSPFTEFAVHVPLFWVLGGVGFCTSVGLVFGMWPALRAANLAPVEALRYE